MLEKILSVVLAITIMSTPITPALAAETTAPDGSAVAATEMEETGIPAEENTEADPASEEEGSGQTEEADPITAQEPEDIVISEQENDSEDVSGEEASVSDADSEDASVEASEDTESEESAVGESISGEAEAEEAVSDENNSDTVTAEEVDDENNSNDTASEDTDLNTSDESSEQSLEANEADNADDAAEEDTTETAERMAADEALSGTCGENAVWSLTEADGEFILTISGTGPMDDYEQALDMDSAAPEDTSAEETVPEDTAPEVEGDDQQSDLHKVPWYDTRDRVTVVVVEEGISTVGSYAFSGFSSLKEVILPGSVKTLGEHCFDRCDMLSGIIVPESVSEVRDIAFGEEGTAIHIFYRGTEEQWKNAVGENKVYYGSITYDYIDSEAAEQTQADKGEQDTNPVQINEGAQDTSPAQETEGTKDAAVTEMITAKETAAQATGAGQKASKSTKNTKAAKTAKAGQKTTVKKKQRIKGTSITKLIPGENKVTIKWRKQVKQSEGYQIEYSMDKQFRIKKSKTVFWYEKTSKVISDLESGRKYYFRIRTFNNSGDKNLYSTWSKVKSTKIKAPKSNFKLSKTGINMESGDSRKITAKRKKTGNNEKVKWKSSNKYVASVNRNGKITAKSPGSCIITATSAANSKYKCTLIVNVKCAPVKTIKVKQSGDHIRITWKKPKGVNGYYVYRNGKRIAHIENIDIHEYNDYDAELVNGKKYAYKIVPHANNESNTRSRTASAYYLLPPDQINLENAGCKKIRIEWVASSRLSGYEIQYGTSKKFKSDTKTVTVTGGKKDTRTITVAKDNKAYYVRIRSLKKAGKKKYYSKWSDTYSIKTIRKSAADKNTPSITAENEKLKYSYSFETIGTMKSIYYSFYIVKTENPDVSSFILNFKKVKVENGKEQEIATGVNILAMDNYFIRDMDTYCNYGILKDGYVFAIALDEPGEYRVYVQEDPLNYGPEAPIGTVRINDWKTEYYEWMDSIIAKTTTDDMTNDQKMEAIADYLRMNSSYYKTFLDNDGTTVLIDVRAISHVVPNYIRMEFDSASSPAMLVAFGERIGYPLESMYGDYEYGTPEWYLHHYKAINRETGKKYFFCPSPDSNPPSVNSLKKITTIAELKESYYNEFRH